VTERLLKVLGFGARFWSVWRQEHADVPIVFDVHATNLMNADLRGADFTNADLTDAVYGDKDLAGALHYPST
jgi:uncharacterized protein YjbI with pentapeptide repeats